MDNDTKAVINKKEAMDSKEAIEKKEPIEKKKAVEKKGVLVVGSANMDMVVKTEHFPGPGETILGGHFQMFSGGKGANQAVASAKLGTDTFFLGKMGSDIFKDRLCQSMTEDGVDLSGLITDMTHPTGIALITVDKTGENEIVVASGSNMNLSPGEIEAHSSLFHQVKVVLAQLEVPVETVVRTAQLARDNGAIFILNPAPAVRQLPDELLRLTSYITPNEGELQMLTSVSIDSLVDVKTAALRLIELGVKNVVVTLGDQGALFVSGSSSSSKTFLHVKANPVRPIDTTGAGDAFNGALASALSEDYEIQKALEFANTAASISVTRMGAQSSMPSFEEVLELLKDQ